jgi:hypothetical protein
MLSKETNISGKESKKTDLGFLKLLGSKQINNSIYSST